MHGFARVEETYLNIQEAWHYLNSQQSLFIHPLSEGWCSTDHDGDGYGGGDGSLLFIFKSCW